MPKKIQTLLLSLAFGLGLIPNSGFAAKTQEFIVTAYYSPLPDQCCYIQGSLEADKILNGQGTHAADGTPVYVGMVAAPKSYAFGTKIYLPSIGLVTVHDRGGAISEIPDGPHRIDLWLGQGEEGLARALTFGVQKMTGTIYEKDDVAEGDAVDLQKFPAPLASIQHFKAKTVEVAYGVKNTGVVLVQDMLRDLGYFTEASTGFFGPVTQVSMAAFLGDYGLENNEQTMKEKVTAFLVSALWRKKARQPIAQFVQPGADKKSVREAQRLLRFLGYYRGRSNGIYTDTLRDAIMKFQRAEGIIADANSAGAGRIGPVTRAKILLRWDARIVKMHADKILALKKIDTLLVERGTKISSMLGQGKSGNDVEILQGILADLNYFIEKPNGIFGEATYQAVLSYQLAHKLIESAEDPAAGYVGPATLQQLQIDQKNLLYSQVRAYGWDSI